MAFSQNTAIDLTSEALGTRSVSAGLSGLFLPNTFGRMIALNSLV
jgi:hypothetical protein